MKKRWLFSILVVVLLIFLPPVFSGPSNFWISWIFWVKCQSSCSEEDNACTGTGNKCCSYDESKNEQVCCLQGGGTWAAECTCTDADADRYIREGTTISDCGDVCGTGDQSCLGNNDCDDTNANIHPGINENTDALCSDGIDNNCNKDRDDSWDNDPNTGKDCQDLSCAGQTGPNSKICCPNGAADCGNDDCKTETCSSDECTISNRAQCSAAECPAGPPQQYCDAAGGNCQTPDASSAVCLNCVTDTTPETWTSTDHQDAGVAYSGDPVCIDPPSCNDIKTETEYTDLFDSDGDVCLASSCSDNDAAKCACYDSSGTAVEHNGALASGACCGNDANEFYKKDYYGGECVGNAAANVNDCVWSDGNAQASDTGNKEYWCYLHEWNECIADADIGKKVGGVTCAGTSSDKKWTPNSNVLTENQYSCIDGLDNDGDGDKDCADTDCAGTISGSVKDTDDNPIGSAEIDVLKNAIRVHTAYTDAFGNYLVDDSSDVICGNYDIIASASGYVSSTQSIELLPNEAKIVNFILVLGTTCEADCTYAGDDIIHKECQGINNCDLCNFGCDFCNPAVAANACNLAKSGWIRNYDDPAQPECQQTGCVIECGKGCPIAKIETKADVTCDEENLIRITKLVTYKGKLAKLNIIVCG